ncbi:hypothetical protein [Cronobacter sakazakii]
MDEIANFLNQWGNE